MFNLFIGQESNYIYQRFTSDASYYCTDGKVYTEDSLEESIDSIGWSKGEKDAEKLYRVIRAGESSARKIPLYDKLSTAKALKTRNINDFNKEVDYFIEVADLSAWRKYD